MVGFILSNTVVEGGVTVLPFSRKLLNFKKKKKKKGKNKFFVNARLRIREDLTL